MKELEDLDIMPFGKYYKERVTMAEIPAGYLHYLWTSGLKEHELKQNSPQGAVARYIQRNLIHLKKEHPDGIWS
jgi:uncharacterized protein (DUF3820 family)